MILFILQKFYSAFELITKMINRHEDAERLDRSDENELSYLETSDFRPKESYIILSQSVAFFFFLACETNPCHLQAMIYISANCAPMAIIYLITQAYVSHLLHLYPYILIYISAQRSLK